MICVNEQIQDFEWVIQTTKAKQTSQPTLGKEEEHPARFYKAK